MKIAFISYEYLPDTGFGGIATYTFHAARMLAGAGHHVEVVCGSPYRSGSETVAGVVVNRVRTGTEDGWQFGPVAGSVLTARHRAVDGFDIVESPEYRAEGAEFIASHPATPLVVKLHTPSFLVHRLSRASFGFFQKARFVLGALRRGRRPRLPTTVESQTVYEFERVFTHAADRIAAPSCGIAHVVGREWELPTDRLDTFPLPFESPGDLASVPLPKTGVGNRILFIGRLEPRKGVQHLALALRQMRRRFPNLALRCVGNVTTGPVAGQPMDAYMRQKAGRDAASIEFPGAQPRERLAVELAAADVCVFPSLWENFPYVCLEAMTAARAVVGSSAGGMAEMLASGAGVVTEPGCPRRWAAAIEPLLADGSQRRQLGEAARDRVEREYSYQKLVPKYLACFEAAIKYRRARGPRPSLPPRPQAKL